MSKDTRDAGNLGVLVKEFEVSVVKRQRESVDVSNLRQNAVIDIRTRDPLSTCSSQHRCQPVRSVAFCNHRNIKLTSAYCSVKMPSWILEPATPFPHAVASTAVSLSGPWHSVSTATSNWLRPIVLLNLVTETVVTMDRTNVSRCTHTANSILFCSRIFECQLIRLHAVSQDPFASRPELCFGVNPHKCWEAPLKPIWNITVSVVEGVTCGDRVSLSPLIDLNDWLLDWLTGWLLLFSRVLLEVSLIPQKVKKFSICCGAWNICKKMKRPNTPTVSHLWYDMIWYDKIQYDTIWYDIWYDMLW